jgi:hypothetical protein
MTIWYQVLCQHTWHFTIDITIITTTGIDGCTAP